MAIEEEYACDFILKSGARAGHACSRVVPKILGRLGVFLCRFHGWDSPEWNALRNIRRAYMEANPKAMHPWDKPAYQLHRKTHPSCSCVLCTAKYARKPEECGSHNLSRLELNRLRQKYGQPLR